MHLCSQDLLWKVSNTPEQLQTVIETIISTPTGNDFVTFEMKDIALIAVAKKYAGIGVSLVAQVKNTKTPLSIDFGVGDVIVPKQEKRKIPTQLDGFTEPTMAFDSDETMQKKWKAFVCKIDTKTDVFSTVLKTIETFLSEPFIAAMEYKELAKQWSAQNGGWM